MQNPLYGFRLLGDLSNFAQVGIPLAPEFDPRCDVLAIIDSTRNHEATVALKDILEPTGLAIATHFILIFVQSPPSLSHSISELPLTSSMGPSFVPSTLDIPFIPTDLDNSFFPNNTDISFSAGDFNIPSINHEANVFALSSCLDPHTDFADFLLEQTGPGSLHGISEGASLGRIPENSSRDASIAPPIDITSLNAQLTIREVCTCLGLAISDAIYRNNGNHVALFTMVSNHRAASQLLVQLHFEDPRNNPDGTSTTTWAGGRSIRAAEITAALGWTPHTWRKKSIAYAWAEDAAAMKWKGVPPQESDIHFLYYQQWRGIVNMFSRGGYLDMKTPPPAKGDEGSEDSQCARKLVQSTLFSHRTRISPFLEN
ncbi:hypothetical protein B0H21DRAFT_713119 [Amylocystis lapponica]|nr:hypothetical protein B0H21DRAFT_713119 [Amylocystis lapponica]